MLNDLTLAAWELTQTFLADTSIHVQNISQKRHSMENSRLGVRNCPNRPQPPFLHQPPCCCLCLPATGLAVLLPYAAVANAGDGELTKKKCWCGLNGLRVIPMVNWDWAHCSALRRGWHVPLWAGNVLCDDVRAWSPHTKPYPWSFISPAMKLKAKMLVNTGTTGDTSDPKTDRKTFLKSDSRHDVRCTSMLGPA